MAVIGIDKLTGLRMKKKIEDPEIRRTVIKEAIILGAGTLSIVSLVFLGRFIHAQLHGACNCLHGLLLEYGPSTVATFLAVGILMSVLGRRTSTRLRVQNELYKANRRMKGDLEAAAEIQRSLLPHSPPDSQRIKFHWSFEPSDELAGDTLNVFSLADHQLVLYMLDVSGHGVSAALLSVTLHRLLSPGPDGPSVVLADTDGTGRRPVPPAEVARQLNEQFPMRPEGGQYFTLLYGLLNTETLEFRFTCAGHPPPIYIPENDDARILKVNGFPIGLLQEATYEDHVVTLAKGDRLYFYSDGVTEAMNPQEDIFGQERWLDALRQVRDKSLKDSLSALMGSLKTWCAGSSCGDDISILAVEVVK